ncbi:hypothetical protein BH09ACT8_BH09ACT8_14240 [soil metagenome]
MPIWVVCVDDGVYVRTWYRRESGWFGQVLQARQACIRVPGVLADASVTDIAAGSTELRRCVDDAYRAKYRRGGVRQMVSDSAAATALLLQPLGE